MQPVTDIRHVIEHVFNSDFGDKSHVINITDGVFEFDRFYSS